MKKEEFIIKVKFPRSIITGGAGFIGSNLTDHLVRIGHKVTVIDNFVSGKKTNLSHHKKKRRKNYKNRHIKEQEII